MKLMGLVLFTSLSLLPAEPTIRHDFLGPWRPNNLLASDNNGDDGRPPRPSRVPGGGRNPCLDMLVALVPGIDTIALDEENCQPTSLASIAMTREANPTLWVYVPESDDVNLTAEVTLIQNQRAVAQWLATVPESSGVTCLQLPYELETETLYEWRLALRLTDSPADNPKVGGLIQYVNQTDSYWSDDLTMVGQQLMAQPEEGSLNDAWKQLLAEQGLEAISQIPIVDNCLALEEVD